MTELECMNLMAIACQNNPLNDSDPNNDSEASQYKPAIDRARHEILSQNWFKWNSHLQTIEPDSNGDVKIPNRSGVINFMFDPTVNDTIVEKELGGALWNRQTNTKLTTSINVLLADDTQFELIPEKFAHWIAWRAAELMSFKLNGAEGNIGYIINEKRKARSAALNSEPGNILGMSQFAAISSGYANINNTSQSRSI